MERHDIQILWKSVSDNAIAFCFLFLCMNTKVCTNQK